MKKEIDIFFGAAEGLKNADKVKSSGKRIKVIPKIKKYFTAEEFIDMEISELQFVPKKERLDMLIHQINLMKQQYDLKKLKPNWVSKK